MGSVVSQEDDGGFIELEQEQEGGAAPDPEQAPLDQGPVIELEEEGGAAPGPEQAPQDQGPGAFLRDLSALSSGLTSLEKNNHKMPRIKMLRDLEGEYLKKAMDAIHKHYDKNHSDGGDPDDVKLIIEEQYIRQQASGVWEHVSKVGVVHPELRENNQTIVDAAIKALNCEIHRVRCNRKLAIGWYVHFFSHSHQLVKLSATRASLIFFLLTYFFVFLFLPGKRHKLYWSWGWRLRQL